MERVAAPLAGAGAPARPAPVKASANGVEPIGPAYPPVASAPRPWELDTEPEPAPRRHRDPEPVLPASEPEASDQAHDDHEPEKAPALRVVAEPEDDYPEIEWKLPSNTLLDTVTARRERMADEIK